MSARLSRMARMQPGRVISWGSESELRNRGLGTGVWGGIRIPKRKPVVSMLEFYGWGDGGSGSLLMQSHLVAKKRDSYRIARATVGYVKGMIVRIEADRCFSMIS